MNENKEKLDAERIGIKVEFETKLIHDKKKLNIERLFYKTENKKQCYLYINLKLMHDKKR